MSTHNVCFHGAIIKNIMWIPSHLLLSGPMALEGLILVDVNANTNPGGYCINIITSCTEELVLK